MENTNTQGQKPKEISPENTPIPSPIDKTGPIINNTPRDDWKKTTGDHNASPGQKE